MTRGYLLAFGATACFAFGGILARWAFAAGIEPATLAQWRILLGGLSLIGFAAVARRGHLEVRAADLPAFAAFGVLGIAGVQLGYYESIARIPLGLALVIQYLAVVLVLGWLALRGRPIGKRLWAAAALTVGGCFFAVGAYDGDMLALNALGGAIALANACAFALYFILGEHLTHRYPRPVVLAWGFAFAALAWSIRRPPWELPWRENTPEQWALIGGLVVLATLVSYALSLSAVRILSAGRAGIAATAEPVVAAALAWTILGERLQPVQVAGGLVVVAGRIVAQSVRREQATV